MSLGKLSANAYSRPGRLETGQAFSKRTFQVQKGGVNQLPTRAQSQTEHPLSHGGFRPRASTRAALAFRPQAHHMPPPGLGHLSLPGPPLPAWPLHGWAPAPPLWCSSPEPFPPSSPLPLPRPRGAAPPPEEAGVWPPRRGSSPKKRGLEVQPTKPTGIRLVPHACRPLPAAACRLGARVKDGSAQAQSGEGRGAACKGRGLGGG